MRYLIALLLSTLPLLASPNTMQGVQFCPLRLNAATNASVQAWYDPNSPLNTLNGAGMSQLYDQTGLGHNLDQSTAASQPLLTNMVNGTLCLEFDGVDDYMKTATFPLVQPTTVVGVFEQVSWVANGVLCDGFSGSESGATYQAVASPTIVQYAGNAVTNPNSDLTVGTFGVVQSVFNGALSSITVNRSVASGDDSGSQSMNGVTLAARAGGGSQWGNIRTADLLLLNRTLTTSEQSYIVQGLARKAGVNVW